MTKHLAKRRRRWAPRANQIREHERRYAALQPDVEPVVAHDPPHLTGCLRCFVARGESAGGNR